jgi:hypothetical protein
MGVLLAIRESASRLVEFFSSPPKEAPNFEDIEKIKKIAKTLIPKNQNKYNFDNMSLDELLWRAEFIYNKDSHPLIINRLYHLLTTKTDANGNVKNVDETDLNKNVKIALDIVMSSTQSSRTYDDKFISPFLQALSENETIKEAFKNQFIQALYNDDEGKDAYGEIKKDNKINFLKTFCKNTAIDLELIADMSNVEEIHTKYKSSLKAGAVASSIDTYQKSSKIMLEALFIDNTINENIKNNFLQKLHLTDQQKAPYQDLINSGSNKYQGKSPSH